MKKIKKVLLGLGGIFTFSLPVIAAVSCSDTSNISSTVPSFSEQKPEVIKDNSGKLLIKVEGRNLPTTRDQYILTLDDQNVNLLEGENSDFEISLTSSTFTLSFKNSTSVKSGVYTLKIKNSNTTIAITVDDQNQNIPPVDNKPDDNFPVIPSDKYPIITTKQDFETKFLELYQTTIIDIIENYLRATEVDKSDCKVTEIVEFSFSTDRNFYEVSRNRELESQINSGQVYNLKFKYLSFYVKYNYSYYISFLGIPLEAKCSNIETIFDDSSDPSLSVPQEINEHFKTIVWLGDN